MWQSPSQRTRTTKFYSDKCQVDLWKRVKKEVPGFVKSLDIYGVTAKSEDIYIYIYIYTHIHTHMDIYTECFLAGDIRDTVGIPQNSEMAIRSRFWSDNLYFYLPYLFIN